MKHSYYEGNNQNVIIMLHGTGGDENDLIQIAKYIDQDAHLLGIRGNVKEGLANRYFKRNTDGSFDEEDLNFRSHELYDKIQDLLKEYDLEGHKINLIGYSNGANILIHILKLYSSNFEKAVLLHPSSGIEETKFKKQKHLRVLITYGINDPFISEASFKNLKEDLENSKIQTEEFKHLHGHQITQEELEAAKIFYWSNDVNA